VNLYLLLAESLQDVAKAFIYASALGHQGMRPRLPKVLFIQCAKITGTNQKWQESMEAYLKLFGRILPKWSYCAFLMILWIANLDKTTTNGSLWKNSIED